MKLIILRGVPGSGKTSLARYFEEHLGASIHAADDYFYDEGEVYHFDPQSLSIAHKWCQLKVEQAMQDEEQTIVVHNTCTREKEVRPYLTLAANYGYEVSSLIVENRHEGTSVHDVPEDVVDKMRTRLRVNAQL